MSEQNVVLSEELQSAVDANQQQNASQNTQNELVSNVDEDMVLEIMPEQGNQLLNKPARELTVNDVTTLLKQKEAEEKRKKKEEKKRKKQEKKKNKRPGIIGAFIQGFREARNTQTSDKTHLSNLPRPEVPAPANKTKEISEETKQTIYNDAAVLGITTRDREFKDIAKEVVPLVQKLRLRASNMGIDLKNLTTQQIKEKIEEVEDRQLSKTSAYEKYQELLQLKADVAKRKSLLENRIIRTFFVYPALLAFWGFIIWNSPEIYNFVSAKISWPFSGKVPEQPPKDSIVQIKKGQSGQDSLNKWITEFRKVTKTPEASIFAPYDISVTKFSIAFGNDSEKWQASNVKLVFDKNGEVAIPPECDEPPFAIIASLYAGKNGKSLWACWGRTCKAPVVKTFYYTDQVKVKVSKFLVPQKIYGHSFRFKAIQKGTKKEFENKGIDLAGRKFQCWKKWKPPGNKKKKKEKK